MQANLLLVQSIWNDIRHPEAAHMLAQRQLEGLQSMLPFSPLAKPRKAPAPQLQVSRATGHAMVQPLCCASHAAALQPKSVPCHLA